MSTLHMPSGRVFRKECGLIDVTSRHRPDEKWHHVDPAGHVHVWTFDGQPGTYRPAAKAEVPTVRWVRTGTGYYEDGEPYPIGHYECRKCGAEIELGYRADDTPQYIAGLTHCYIDDRSVSEEEFRSEVEREMKSLS